MFFPHLSERARTGIGNTMVYAALLLIMLLSAYVRLRLMSTPLDRDEGAWAYAGQLIMNGIPPYSVFYDIKMPGVYYIYAAIMSLFGQTPSGIHLGLLACNLASILLVFNICRPLYGSPAALCSALFFACASLSAKLEGFSANTEHFAVLFLLLSLFLYFKNLKKYSSPTLFFSGLSAGICLIIKQPAVLFAVFIAVHAAARFFKEKNSRNMILRLLLFSAGAVLPLLAICLLYLADGSFSRFYSSAVLTTLNYAGAVGFRAGVNEFLNTFPASFSTIWPFVAVSTAGLLTGSRAQSPFNTPYFLILLAVFSFAVVSAGFYFRPHYYLFLLPSLSLAISAFVKNPVLFPSLKWPAYAAPLIILAAFSYFLVSENAYLFKTPPQAVTRQVFGENPFIESVPIAAYIKAHSGPDSRIAVLGSEPQIFFYSKRRSATGYAYMNILIDSLKMQKEACAEIAAAKPEYLVFVNIRISWLLTGASEKYIFYWYKDYVKKYYDIKGVAEIFSPEYTKYVWDKEAENYKPSHGYFINIYKRKPGM